MYSEYFGSEMRTPERLGHLILSRVRLYTRRLFVCLLVSYIITRNPHCCELDFHTLISHTERLGFGKKQILHKENLALNPGRPQSQSRICYLTVTWCRESHISFQSHTCFTGHVAIKLPRVLEGFRSYIHRPLNSASGIIGSR